MVNLARFVPLAMAFVLLWAGLDKARSPASAATTLRQLGLADAAAGVWARFLVLAELSVGLGLIFKPGSVETLGGVVLLAGAFGLAGLIALGRDEPIRCSCFGPGRNTVLGLRQVVASPVWLAGAALLWLTAPAPPSVPEAAASLAVVGLTMAVLRAVPVMTAWKQAHGDRRSAQEMYVWLQG